MQHRTDQPGSDLPVVAVSYGLGSAAPMEIATAARGLCAVVWAYDATEPGADEVIPLLRLTGDVCDVTGCSPADGMARLGRWEPAGITTFAEPRVRWTAAVAAGLALRYHTAEIAARLTDKHVQRSCLASAGLDPIRFARVDRPDQIAEAVAHVGLPAIVKPARGAASRNTHRVDSHAEATRLISDLLTGDVDRREDELVIEELLVGDVTRAGAGWGDYVSVESLVVDGEPHPLAVLGKFTLAPPFRECGTFYPSTLASADIDAATQVTADVLRAIGVQQGFCHTELKLTAAGPRLIEVNGRLGGGVRAVLEQAAGLDVVALALRDALGEEKAPVDGPRPDGVGFQYLTPAPQRVCTVSAVRGVRAAQSLPGVVSAVADVAAGDTLDWRDGTLTHLATVIGRVADHEALRELVHKVDHVLRVELD